MAIVDGSKTYQFYTVHMAEAFEDLQFGHETFYIFLLLAKCLLSSKGFPGVFPMAQKTYDFVNGTVASFPQSSRHFEWQQLAITKMSMSALRTLF